MTNQTTDVDRDAVLRDPSGIAVIRALLPVQADPARDTWRRMEHYEIPSGCDPKPLWWLLWPSQLYPDANSVSL